MLRRGFVGNRLSGKKIESEALCVRVEKFANAFYTRRFQDETGVVIFLYAIDNLGIVIRGSVGMFLPRQGQNHACVVSRRRWQYIRSLPCTDFKLGPFPPEINSRGGFYDVRNVSSSNACGDFKKIDFSSGVGFQEFGVSNAADQPENLHQSAIQVF